MQRNIEFLSLKAIHIDCFWQFSHQLFLYRTGLVIHGRLKDYKCYRWISFVSVLVAISLNFVFQQCNHRGDPVNISGHISVQNWVAPTPVKINRRIYNRIETRLYTTPLPLLMMPTIVYLFLWEHIRGPPESSYIKIISDLKNTTLVFIKNGRVIYSLCS